MIKAHLNVNGVYVECHATKRACPRKDHKEFKSLNEMNDYNEKLSEHDSDSRKLSKTKVSDDKVKKMDAVIERAKTDHDALDRIHQLQLNNTKQLEKDRAEFEKKADRTMRKAFKNLEPQMESAYKAAGEIQTHLNILRNKSLPLDMNVVSYGMKTLALHGLKMSDFLDNDSVRSIQTNGSEAAANAVDKKLPYSEMDVTFDGKNIRVEASARDSDGKPFTVSGVMPPEKYVDGVGRNFNSACSDHNFITHRGIKTGMNSDELEWPDGIRNRIDYTSDVIKRNGLTNTDFPTVIMNTGHDSNSLIISELNLDRKDEEISKNDVTPELHRLDYLDFAARKVKDGQFKNISLAIEDMNAYMPSWMGEIFHTEKSENYDNPSIGNWLSDHGIDTADND